MTCTKYPCFVGVKLLGSRPIVSLNVMLELFLCSVRPERFTKLFLKRILKFSGFRIGQGYVYTCTCIYLQYQTCIWDYCSTCLFLLVCLFIGNTTCDKVYLRAGRH